MERTEADHSTSGVCTRTKKNCCWTKQPKRSMMPFNASRTLTMRMMGKRRRHRLMQGHSLMQGHLLMQGHRLIWMLKPQETRRRGQLGQKLGGLALRL
mmetsp:Transcript_7109/g.25758  ORF Transcript_7109/g.25758 Transcript_7109/m.25758 type:complete len:98 (+) Transcript_7109:797-1090(+)